MSKTQRIITKIHRIFAGGLLLSMIPAAYFSFRGGSPNFWVYLPLFFLFPLILTGTYQLVLPWVRKARAGRKSGDGPS